MAKLTKKDVLHVAELSNLSLTKSEAEKFLSQLSKIVDFVGTLNEVDTSNTKSTNQTTGLTNMLREDTILADRILNQDEALSGTSNDDYFEVATILENRTEG